MRVPRATGWPCVGDEGRRSSYAISCTTSCAAPHGGGSGGRTGLVKVEERGRGKFDCARRSFGGLRRMCGQRRSEAVGSERRRRARGDESGAWAGAEKHGGVGVAGAGWMSRGWSRWGARWGSVGGRRIRTSSGSMPRVWSSGSMTVAGASWRSRTAGVRAVDAGQGNVRAAATNGFGLAHSRAISWVAAYLTLRGRGWIGKRQLMRDDRWRVPVIWPRGGIGTHRPDLVSLHDRRVVAVEVELTAKAPRRLRAILAGYDHAIRDGAFDAVTYVTTHDGVAAGLGRARRQTSFRDGDFPLLRLDAVRQRARELTGSRPWPGASR